MRKIMNHTEYPKSLKSLSDEQLKFRMRDAHEAVMAYPEGENSEYYQDEVCYCSDELFEREKQRGTLKISVEILPQF
jgi:hypothetical protein